MTAKIVVKCIIRHTELNRLLLIRRSGQDDVGAGTWENIGGNMEDGEMPEEALRREIREETGLTDVRVCRIAYLAMLKGDPPDLLIVWLGETKTEKVALSAEHQEYLWADEGQCRRLLPEAIIQDYEHNHIFDLLRSGGPARPE